MDNTDWSSIAQQPVTQTYNTPSFSAPSSLSAPNLFTASTNSFKQGLSGFLGGDSTYNTNVMTPTQWQEFGASGGTIGNSGQVLDINGKEIGQLDSNLGLMDSKGGLSSMLGTAKSVFDIGSGLYGIYSNKKVTDATLDNLANQTRIANAAEARTQTLFDDFQADKAALNSSYASKTKVG